MTTRLVLALLLLAGLASAQQPQSTDPRNVPDPRDVPDPREQPDPRGQPQPRFEELEGQELYDALYAAGEEVRLANALREDGWQILGYIDSHCEGWLALVEGGAGDTVEGRAKMAEMQAKGRKMAEIADRALVDTRFSAYVSSFYSWDAEQQKQFREGQALFKKGYLILNEAANAQEALAALTPLQQSLERSRPLADTWGQSMALVLMGRIQADNAQVDAARHSLDEARRLGREIRDLSSVWDALAKSYELGVVRRRYEDAREALQEQFLIAKDLGDEQTGAMVTRQMVDLEQVISAGG